MALIWANHQAATPNGIYRISRTEDGYSVDFENDELAHVGFNSGDQPYLTAQRHAEDHYMRTIPDRVCSDPNSEFYWPQWKGLRVWINEKERGGDCVEFCVSEGWARVWVRLPNGKLKQERGMISTIKLKGTIRVAHSE